MKSLKVYSFPIKVDLIFFVFNSHLLIVLAKLAMQLFHFLTCIFCPTLTNNANRKYSHNR